MSVKCSLKRDARTISASRKSIISCYGNEVFVRGRIQYQESKFPGSFRDDLTVLDLFICQLSYKSAVPKELTRETTERFASETDRVKKRYLTKQFNCLSL